MYWLLPLDEQEEIRNKITNLASELSLLTNRVQVDQVFTFNGRKDRRKARAIIKNLSNANELICDPFSGSGIFAYAGLDEGRRVLMNEWEPFAYRMSTAPFRDIPTTQQIEQGLQEIDAAIGQQMKWLYRTICANCGAEHVFDGLFYDRDPEEYYNPVTHKRMGPNGENIIFRNRYKCPCGAKEKHFDDSDMAHLITVRQIPVNHFPNDRLIENSRINFTAPNFVHYGALFPHRSKLALMYLYDAINNIVDNIVRDALFDAFLSILQLAKYCDYRSKSQDPHCPPKMLKENNLYHRFIEQVRKRNRYLHKLGYNNNQNVQHSCEDFREFLDRIPDGAVDLLITDPPYGDSVQYFESAQRFHPFLGYSLRTDNVRLEKEVVISDAPSRPNKHSREQFLNDIESLFEKSSRVVKDHGYLVLYFRPEQNHWVADLNQLKVFGRKYGFEPLITIDVAQNDPSMRVLASTAWTFASDICFVFLKLRNNERRWYEGDTDIDELVYLSAREAAGDRGQPFTKSLFQTHLARNLRQNNLIKLSGHQYAERIEQTLMRFCNRQGAQYLLTGESPYELMHFGLDPEIRMREFIPIVVEELSANNEPFTFEQFVLRLSTYLDNGNRTIIKRLHQVNRLIPELLLQHAEEDANGRGFVARQINIYSVHQGRTNILHLNPAEFEQLIAEYFRRRGFSNVSVIGQSNDRGVDVLAKALDGTVHLIQCKRYRPGNNIGSSPIQRVDSYRRTRNADQAWVVTTSDFTREGLDEGRITGVHLINGQVLMNSLEIYFPGQFYVPQ